MSGIAAVCGSAVAGATVATSAVKRIHDAKRVALDLLLILILSAPSNHAGRNSTGIWGVNRQGCRFSRPAPWMARGGGPPNHWRITGTPSLGEVPSGGARAFCLLLRSSKVSRCKSGTNLSHHPNNGYTPHLSNKAYAVFPVWLFSEITLVFPIR